MERYDPKTIEPKWQQVWEAGGPSRRRTLLRERRRTSATGTSSRCCVPVGTLHMGHVLNYTMGDVVTHLRRRKGWKVSAADGLRLLRPARRERGDHRGRPPARDHRAEHRRDPGADEATGLGDRLVARGLRARGRLLPLDAVAVPEVLRARVGVPSRGARQLVPERPDGRRERVRGRRAVRPLWGARRGADDGAVVLQDHRVRRRPARVRPARGRLVAGADEDDPAELDRPLEGAEILFRIDELDEDVPVFTTRPDTLFGATFFVLAPEHPLVERVDNDEVREYAKRTASGAASCGWRRRRRPASSRVCTSTTPSTASACPSTSPTTC